MPILDPAAIQRLLPHRYPFLLVDKVIELEKRKRIVAVKQVTINEPFFQGHFPGHPVMPGVMIIEALAQAGAILAMLEFDDPSGKIPLFTGLDGARFRRPVVPGDTLELVVEPLRTGNRLQKMRGVARVDGQVVAEGDILCIITDRKE